MPQSPQASPTAQYSPYALSICCAAVFAAWGLFGRAFYTINGSDSGLIGDSFGALNCLFSGLAFVGVIFAILQQNAAHHQQERAVAQQADAIELQKADLQNQRRLLEAQLEEMRRAREVTEAQAKVAQLTLNHAERASFLEDLRHALRSWNALQDSIQTMFDQAAEAHQLLMRNPLILPPQRYTDLCTSMQEETLPRIRRLDMECASADLDSERRSACGTLILHLERLYNSLGRSHAPSVIETLEEANRHHRIVTSHIVHLRRLLPKLPPTSDP